MGAESPDFPDTSWRKVDLPHDWSIEDLPGTSSTFNPDAAGQVSTGFTTGGTAWYRKSFTITAKEKGQRACIVFDGIYMNADIWLNGRLLGNHPYGYTPFWYDITDNLIAGKANVIAIQVKNEGQTSRWYSGVAKHSGSKPPEKHPNQRQFNYGDRI
jgi:beta-galactosidase